MISRSRSCLAARLTTLLAIPYSSGYRGLYATSGPTPTAPKYMLTVPSGTYAGTSIQASIQAAPKQRLQCLPLLGIASSFSSSRTVLAARTPMVGPAPPPEPPAPPVLDKDGNELSKRTKRKVALVVGYVGTDFHGWQQSTDRGVRTVEGVLETALWKAGGIANSNYGDLNKIGWGRTSRTDKGVHASKTVAAAKLLYPPETFAEDGLSQFAKDTLNEHLPADVRCFSVSKVPKSFRGRDECTLREYSYYLPKHLLPDEAADRKFRSLLDLFVGTHSFHNFASTKGRQLKEVRRRVQASIDRKNLDIKNAQQQQKAGAGEGTGTEDQASLRSQNTSAVAGTKRGRSNKDDWRTWRHKKKNAVDQDEEDSWYGKSKPSWRKEEVSASAGAGSADRDRAESVPIGDVAELTTVGKDCEAFGDGDYAEDAGVDEEDTSLGDDEGEVEQEREEVGDQVEEGPEKVLMLRELRTSIYRCEALDDMVSFQRPGAEKVDEFIRIDIRGKAFVYNQIRLMIGGALCEARGELFPGFVAAALNTPYRIRVPLAPAEGLVLESQAFTRHTNALVLDPRDLASVGGTMAKWGDGSNSGNNMQTTGRLQTLLTTAQLEECDRWRDEHIVPAVADAWVSRGAAESFLSVVDKFFVGQQDGEELQAAIKEHMAKVETTEKAAEEKHNKYRRESKERGSTKYKDLLPKNIATRIVCKFRLLPGNKVSAIQRGVAKSMEQGKLPALADNDEVLGFIEKMGVDELAIAGGFNPADIVTAF